MLFMGEEWGTRTPWQFFTDHPEPDLAAAVRDGRRREFGGHGWDVLYGGDIEVPDPQDPATFRASILDRTELDDPAHPEHARLRDWYRTLIALRRTVPDLASGDLSATDLVWGGASEREQDDVPWDGWLVLHRGSARVVINLSGEEAAVPVHTDGPSTWPGRVGAGGAPYETRARRRARRDATPRSVGRPAWPRRSSSAVVEPTSAAPSAASEPRRDSARKYFLR